MGKTEEKMLLFFTGVSNVILFSVVLCMMWHWFVVPKFPGAAEFTIFEMLGLSTMVRIMTTRTSHAKENDPRTLMQKVMWDLSAAPVLLVMGYVIHLLAVRFPWR